MFSNALLQVALGAVGISFSSVFIKFSNIGPTAAGFYRLLFGTISLVIITATLKRSFRINKKAFLICLLAAFWFTVDLNFWHSSIPKVGPGLATILANLQVFFMAGIGVLFYKERPTIRLFFAIPLALAGLVMLVGDGWNNLGTDYRLGILYGIVAAIAYVVYLLSIRNIGLMKDKPDTITMMCYVSFLGMLIMAAETPILGNSFVIPNITTFVSLLALGIFCQAIGWILISTGLPKIDTSKIGLILLTQPTLSFIWDILIFDRPTGLIDGAGAVITLVAIYMGVKSGTTEKA